MARSSRFALRASKTARSAGTRSNGRAATLRLNQKSKAARADRTPTRDTRIERPQSAIALGNSVVVVDAAHEPPAPVVVERVAIAAGPVCQTVVVAFAHQTLAMRGKPEWNDRARRLYVDGMLEIELDVPAANLERALAAFADEHWPEWIADPFPRDEVIPSQRLRDTVYRLNRCRKVKLVHFSSDGRASGIRCRRT